MCDFETSGRVAVEEGFQDLSCLVLARIARVRDDGYLQVVVEPRSQFLCISLPDVLRDRDEYIISLILSIRIYAAAHCCRSREQNDEMSYAHTISV